MLPRRYHCLRSNSTRTLGSSRPGSRTPCLRQVGLKIKPSKSVIFKTEVEFLRHLVNEHGISPLPDKLEAIRNWPDPHCLGDVQAFYGLVSYYRRLSKTLQQ